MRLLARIARLARVHAGAFMLGGGGEAEGRRPGLPRQRDAAAVAALFDLVSDAVERGRILQLVPRDVGDLWQAELLTLVDISGTW